jgi:hypothetical protein
MYESALSLFQDFSDLGELAPFYKKILDKIDKTACDVSRTLICLPQVVAASYRVSSYAISSR